MPLEIGLWRVDDKPTKVATSSIRLEARLEELIESDVTILGEPLLLVGRQVPTSYGKVIDLMGVDADGVLHVLELKRDRTPREVVAQVLDYGSWVGSLTHEDILEIFAAYGAGEAFEQAFSAKFGVSPPETLNESHRLTIIASDVDPATERIVEYLATGYGVPLNVVFFRYFEDGDRHYLARTWLIDEARTPSTRAGKSSGGKEPWNGQDWYVSFGEESNIRNWDDARRYGFVSAGGGAWFSRTLRALPAGGRVFVCIPKRGYVGVGTVSGEARPFDEATVEVDGQVRRLAELELQGTYHHSNESNEAEDNEEYVVPVRWTAVRPRDQAVWETGMFANQNSACKLRNRFTLEELARQFDLEE
jgi:hypothetical protein